MISIIVPVYNGKKYVDRMISSIMAQTLRDFELFIVDNNSSDGSYEHLLKNYANKDYDVSIHVLRQEKPGVSAARNMGIDYANGEYLLFLDCDDEIPDNYLEELLKEYSCDENCGLVYCDYELTGDESRQGLMVSDGAFLIGIEAFIERLFKVEFYQGYVWNKLFMAEAGIRFDEEIHYNEDRLFLVKYLLAMEAKQKLYVCSTMKTRYIYHLDSEGAIALEKKHGVTERETTEFLAFQKMSKAIAEGNAKNTTKMLEALYANMGDRMLIMLEKILSKRHPFKYRKSVFRSYTKDFSKCLEYMNIEENDYHRSALSKKLKLYRFLGVAFAMNEY